MSPERLEEIRAMLDGTLGMERRHFTGDALAIRDLLEEVNLLRSKVADLERGREKAVEAGEWHRRWGAGFAADLAKANEALAERDRQIRRVLDELDKEFGILYRCITAQTKDVKIRQSSRDFNRRLQDLRDRLLSENSIAKEENDAIDRIIDDWDPEAPIPDSIMIHVRRGQAARALAEAALKVRDINDLRSRARGEPGDGSYTEARSGWIRLEDARAFNMAREAYQKAKDINL